MYVAFLVVILLPIIAIQADDPKPCCYPEQMTGEVYKSSPTGRSQKLYTFYIDFERKVIVEDWHGFIGTDFVLYDLETNERYRSRTRGRGCTKDEIKNVGNYAQCVPEDATFVNSYPVYDEKIANAFTYFNDDIQVMKSVDSVTCLPYSIRKVGTSGSLTLHYKNVKDHIEDESIFDKDIEGCESP